MRVAAALLALPLLLSLGAVASADDGRPAPTVGRATELPPRRVAATAGTELVFLVGGLGSRPDEAAWAALTARLRGDPRYEIRLFGADPRFPYDTFGSVEGNAARLQTELRDLAPRYAAIHVVAHSMGGVVMDRALARGLSRGDGVRTYVALAAPHSGSTVARVLQNTIALAGQEGPDLQEALRRVATDPASAAVGDLAVRRPDPTGTPGITRLHLRLATDALVPGPDTAVSGVESRTILPSSLQTLEGHGGVLNDPQVLDTVAATIGTGVAPPDRRGLILRQAAKAVSRDVDAAVLVLLAAAALVALAAAWTLSAARAPRRLSRRGWPDVLVAR